MSLADRYGLPISTASPAAAERYQEGMDRLLCYGPGADDSFVAALAADEGLALAHAGRALLALFLGDAAVARAAIDQARRLAGGATRRERQHVEALATVAGGDGAGGLALIEEHVAEFPRDALLVNQASSAIGLGGRADREQYRLDFLERLAPAYGDGDWWFQCALGFVYHEVGRFDESRDLSLRSLAQRPDNANAGHNLVHVSFETGDHDGGAAFLADWMRGYPREAPFHCHLAWHLALFELQRGRDDRALAVFDQDILPSGNARLAVMDGSALLWRFRLYGDDGAAALPWRPLADLARRVARPGFVFGDIHAALAYASCGDEAALAALIDGLRALEARGHPIAGRVALPLVQGAAAFAAGDHATALGYLEPVDAEIHRMGGSHAQWELFEETMVACHLRLGRHEDAVRLLRRRLARRPSPRDLAWLARAEASLARTGGDSR